MKVGYIRVSTEEQNTARQEILMEQLGVEKIYIDKLSGKSKERPQLKEMLGFVRMGDTVIVESISRFARNTRDLLELIDLLTEKGVEFVSKKESIDTTTPAGKFMLTVYALCGIFGALVLCLIPSAALFSALTADMGAIWDMFSQNTAMTGYSLLFAVCASVLPYFFLLYRSESGGKQHRSGSCFGRTYCGNASGDGNIQGDTVGIGIYRYYYCNFGDADDSRAKKIKTKMLRSRRNIFVSFFIIALFSLYVN